jgi:putative ABC transport system permease protein
VPVAEVSLLGLVEYVKNGKRAQWLSATLGSGEGAVKLPAEKILMLFEAERRERQLSDAVGEEALEETGLVFGIGQRDQLLIALSFLVCVVGVANAMLMSVTERFTEIATMKCLVAMDRFVMTMFVFEALIQGAVGGAVGALLGMLLALLRALVEFGDLLGQAGGAFGDLGLGMLGALLMGMLLAAVAAVGPAFVAARLAPMEAMRVD